LDFGFWILKVLPVASFKNSNVAKKQNGMNYFKYKHTRVLRGDIVGSRARATRFSD
jgi:hypothetical protein